MLFGTRCIFPNFYGLHFFKYTSEPIHIQKINNLNQHIILHLYAQFLTGGTFTFSKVKDI